MIRDDKKQAWVTLALSDLDAVQAIVMAKSLEQTYTTRKICLFISEGVSFGMKNWLSQVFYMVWTVTDKELQGLSEGKITNCLVSKAKLWFWTMKEFKKCVFISPDSLITSNCDDLFKYEEMSAIKTMNKGRFDTSIFVFKPDFKIFEKLIILAGTQKGDADDVMNTFFKDWKTIGDKHIAPICGSQTTGGAGMTKEWFKVYNQHVLPFLENQKSESIQYLITDIQQKQKLHKVDFPISVLEENVEDYKNTIAVVGMSCRLPGVNNAQEYWKLLAEGREAIRQFPLERPFTGKTKQRPNIQAGFLSCPVDEFDAKFFGISPREALLMDPQQRLLLEVIWESLEHSGINPQTLRDSDTGVYVGMWQQDYEQHLMDARRSDETGEFLHIFLGNTFSATASRISFLLGLNGPAIAVESGCSSSLNGLHLACESLQSGETSLALVSGVNLILLPFNPFSGKADIEDSMVLSKDFKCKTFDETADGFVRAEACGVVVLKRFEDAHRDGDNILAVVKGSAMNNDGAGTSFGTPNEKAQKKVYRAALKRAKVKAADVSYIETHGTGTAVGDPIEMYAVGQVYSENRTKPLLIGSVKTNIGHCEAAAGIASLIKVILCMEHGAIPPHLNLKTLNPKIDLSQIPAHIPMKLTAWNAPKKLAAISSFSMSATNVHVILQEPPKFRNMQNKSENKKEIFTISAKSEQALIDLRKKYIQYLKGNTDNIHLSDVVFSSNTGRAHLQHRTAVVSSNSAELLSRLEKGDYAQGKAATLKGKVAYLFTGQGSQYIGMAKGLAEEFPAFQKALDDCNKLFQASLNTNLKDLLWNDDSLLNETLYCQPVIFCVQYCLYQLWSFYGIKPDYVLGHSVGEFAAAVCAGILTLESAMKLVVARSKLVNNLSKGSMSAIRASEVKVCELIQLFIKENGHETWVDIAAVNSPEEVVVSGTPESVKKFELFCINNNVQSISIAATHAFHSRDMEPVLVEFGKVAETVATGTSKCVFVSGTLARIMDATEFCSQYWQRHLRDTVRFFDAIRLVWTECKTFVEIGPQPILLGLTMASVNDNTSSGTYIPSLRKKDEATASFNTAMTKLYVSGVDFDWASVYGVRQKRVNLPLYSFQRQKYWFTEDLSGEDELTPLLHPLLGRMLLSPLPYLLFCQTYRLKDLEYMEDHKVANYFIVPVAAMLESFLAASREVLQGESRNKSPITIQNLVVEAPLPLEKNCLIQTIVSSEGQASVEDTLCYKLSLNRKMKNQFDKWKRQAQAVFTPSSKLSDTQTMDLESTKARLRYNHRESMEIYYKYCSDGGVQLGPKFQSIATAWDGPNELLAEIHLPAKHDKYICHPIVLDAMIQTLPLQAYLSKHLYTHIKPEKIGLHLPISIQKFTWLSRAFTSTLYAHKFGGNRNVTLFNSEGVPLGIMEGIELLQTTSASFVRAIRADSLEVPDFMVDRWRPFLGKTSSRVDIYKMIVPCLVSLQVAENKDQIKGIATSKEFANKVDDSNCYAFLSFIVAIQECGWPWPAVGELLSKESWENLLPKYLNKGIIRIYFAELQARGYLVDDCSRSRVIQPLPSCLDCKIIITQIKDRLIRSNFTDAEVQLGDRYFTCLPHILQGKITPLAAFFAEDSAEYHLTTYYTQSILYAHQNILIKAFLSESLANYINSPPKDGILRILEIGAGSGSTAIQCIELLRDLRIPFHYTFTDISHVFLNEARQKLGTGPEMTYQLFNIEEDPLAQGFSPAEFDVIIGVQVIHATVDLAQSLRNLKKVLKLKGLLILGEGFVAMTSHLFVFGMLDGWWRFKDFRLNSKLTALASEEDWIQLLGQSGFANVCCSRGVFLGVLVAQNNLKSFSTECVPVQTKWMLFNDDSELSNCIASGLQANDRKVEVLDISKVRASLNTDPECYLNLCSIGNEEVEGIIYFCTQFKEYDIVKIQERITAPLWNILKGYAPYMNSCRSTPRIVLVTRGIYNIGDSEPGNPNGATAWGMMKVFRNENPNVRVSLIDLDQIVSPVETEQILSQLWNNDEEQFTAFRGNQTLVLRLSYLEKQPIPIQLPSTDRFKFINPESGAFADIEIGPKTKTEVIDNFVEVEVRACALNFRDILMVLKPEGFKLSDDSVLATMDAVGLDVAGVVISVGPKVKRFQVGDQVFGMASDGGLGSHTIISETGLINMPEDMTFVEASTIPCAFVTAKLCLINVAQLTAADRVLIHVATGGVGLAAVQIVKKVGAQIFVTAGSNRKRAYLRALGIKNVYHSRDTSFGAGIERDTNGLGVTVVLNSLTGPNFKETSLKVCSSGARFIEIAKINIWRNEEVKALRPDVKYTIVDLSSKELVKLTNSSWNPMSSIKDYINNGVYKGLPSVVFELSQVREAFHYFQKAMHIGKIVVQIPRFTLSEAGKLEHKTELFNDKSSYLITGGLGGIGVEVVKWMQTMGATTIVLWGRRSPGAIVQRMIDQWNKDGYNIVVIQGDVSEYTDCKAALDHIQQLRLPQLRGIMHAAGVLSDNFITNQTVASVQKVLKPKVYGSWYLHNLTLDYPMEFFVMFSSISAILGIIGQCNHSGANRFLDALTHYRLSMGLPATTINWGGWSDVGAAAHIAASAEAIAGFRMFTPAQGIAALQNIMTLREPQVAVAEVSDWSVVKKIFLQGRFFNELKSEVLDSNSVEKYEQLVEKIKESISVEERQENIQLYIAAILRDILNLTGREVIDIDQNFSELGVDSLMAMEMKNRFQVILGNRTLAVGALQENRTIRSLSTYLTTVMTENGGTLSTRPLLELLLEDVVLPPEIIAPPTSALKPSEFKNVLLTGVTGHLGVHCLVEILNSTSRLTIYCLIRAKTDKEAYIRLQNTLEKYRIKHSNMDRVVPIAGDVTKHKLGLSEENYEMLALQIDGILNSAAKVNHLDGYSDGSEHDMRTHNVFGLVNILKFASYHQSKSLLQTSALFAATKVSYSGDLVEDFPDETDMAPELKMGYLLSKFVGEKLLGEARKRGIPVKVIRFPFIWGNSQTGHMPVAQDHFWSITLESIRTRMIPDEQLNGIPLIAVDQAAAVAKHIFLSDDAEDGMYNLMVNSTLNGDILKDGLAELGILCELATFREWRDAVFEEKDEIMGPWASMYEEENGKSRIYSLHGLSKELKNINSTQFTEKMIRNFPLIENIVTSAQVIVQRHVKAHLAGGIFQSIE